MAVEVYLVRHGQTPNNITGERLYNAALTDLGRRQAERLAAALSGVGLVAVLCSPLLRAMETADAIARAAGLEVDVLNDLVEVNRWDAYVGSARADLGARFPGARLETAMPKDGWCYAGPEEPAAAAARVGRVLDRVAAVPAGSAVALVAHGTFNGMLLAAWLDMPARGAVAFSQDNGCINHLLVEGQRCVCVRRINDTRHLSGVASPPF